MLICRYDDPVGRFIIRLTWGKREAYPSYVIANEGHWSRWCKQEEEHMNDFTAINDSKYINAAPAMPVVTDEEFDRLLALKANEPLTDEDAIGYITTDDSDEAEPTKH